ncbi:MAG: hypothetical protein NTV02_03565 [Candidatus Zambryskibacteria bacterium]|nr:hypothetical protein [Candidatus Zambryskibacteria bacterium]
MQQKKIFYTMFGVLVLTGILNTLGTTLYLYWTVIWFDMIMHFLGGLFVSLFFFSLFSFFRSGLTYIEKLVLGLVFSVLVGLVWEYYELIIAVTDLADAAYWPDTGMDIVMDTLGALVGIVSAHRLEKKNV